MDRQDDPEPPAGQGRELTWYVVILLVAGLAVVAAKTGVLSAIWDRIGS